MPEKWTYSGLRLLDESLNATNVLSDDYRKGVFGYAMLAVREAHEAGFDKGEQSVIVKRKDQALTEVRAKLDLLGAGADSATAARLDEVHAILDAYEVPRDPNALLRR